MEAERHRVAPVIVDDVRWTPGAVAATMRAALDLGATDITTFVPGAHPALPMLEAAGFVTTGEDAYMASAPDLLDPRVASSPQSTSLKRLIPSAVRGPP